MIETLSFMRYIFHTIFHKRWYLRFFGNWEVRTIHGSLPILIELNISNLSVARSFLKSSINNLYGLFHLVNSQELIEKLSWSVNEDFIVNWNVVRYLNILLKFYLFTLIEHLYIYWGIYLTLPYSSQLLLTAVLWLTQI